MKSFSASALLRRLPLWFCLTVLLLLKGISYSTSPPPPPYHEFYLEGRVERADNGPLDQITVAALRFEQGERRIINNTLALTDATGNFSFGCRANDPIDTVATAVVLPGGRFVLSTPFATADVDRVAIELTGETPGEGCDSPHKYTYVQGYRYYDNPFQVIQVDSLALSTGVEATTLQENLPPQRR